VKLCSLCMLSSYTQPCVSSCKYHTTRVIWFVPVMQKAVTVINVVLILKNFFIYSPIGLNFIYVIETTELRCMHYLHARNR